MTSRLRPPAASQSRSRSARRGKFVDVERQRQATLKKFGKLSSMNHLRRLVRCDPFTGTPGVVLTQEEEALVRWKIRWVWGSQLCPSAQSGNKEPLYDCLSPLVYSRRRFSPQKSVPPSPLLDCDPSNMGRTRAETRRMNHHVEMEVEEETAEGDGKGGSASKGVEPCVDWSDSTTAAGLWGVDREESESIPLLDLMLARKDWKAIKSRLTAASISAAPAAVRSSSSRSPATTHTHASVPHGRDGSLSTSHHRRRSSISRSPLPASFLQAPPLQHLVQHPEIRPEDRDTLEEETLDLSSAFAFLQRQQHQQQQIAALGESNGTAEAGEDEPAPGPMASGGTGRMFLSSSPGSSSNRRSAVKESVDIAPARGKRGRRNSQSQQAKKNLNTPGSVKATLSPPDPNHPTTSKSPPLSGGLVSGLEADDLLLEEEDDGGGDVLMQPVVKRGGYSARASFLRSASNLSAASERRPSSVGRFSLLGSGRDLGRKGSVSVPPVAPPRIEPDARPATKRRREKKSEEQQTKQTLPYPTITTPSPHGFLPAPLLPLDLHHPQGSSAFSRLPLPLVPPLSSPFQHALHYRRIPPPHAHTDVSMPPRNSVHPTSMKRQRSFGLTDSGVPVQPTSPLAAAPTSSIAPLRRRSSSLLFSAQTPGTLPSPSAASLHPSPPASQVQTAAPNGDTASARHPLQSVRKSKEFSKSATAERRREQQRRKATSLSTVSARRQQPTTAKRTRVDPMAAAQEKSKVSPLSRKELAMIHARAGAARARGAVGGGRVSSVRVGRGGRGISLLGTHSPHAPLTAAGRGFAGSSALPPASPVPPTGPVPVSQLYAHLGQQSNGILLGDGKSASCKDSAEAAEGKSLRGSGRSDRADPLSSSSSSSSSETNLQRKKKELLVRKDSLAASTESRKPLSRQQGMAGFGVGFSASASISCLQKPHQEQVREKASRTSLQLALDPQVHRPSYGPHTEMGFGGHQRAHGLAGTSWSAGVPSSSASNSREGSAKPPSGGVSFLAAAQPAPRSQVASPSQQAGPQKVKEKGAPPLFPFTQVLLTPIPNKQPSSTQKESCHEEVPSASTSSSSASGASFSSSSSSSFPQAPACTSAGRDNDALSASKPVPSSILAGTLFPPPSRTPMPFSPPAPSNASSTPPSKLQDVTGQKTSAEDSQQASSIQTVRNHHAPGHEKNNRSNGSSAAARDASHKGSDSAPQAVSTSATIASELGGGALSILPSSASASSPSFSSVVRKPPTPSPSVSVG
uniref:Uncharacterized protein n=1 Tax=Chromera velia CCMP2878 TaxID=1169474 RepID=A0A0G4HMG8_9ALVE|eukprot:Cvel_29073.t1-p1 / transcript=Cvel_29073.t1 / gene=Cvel_29073 / organism=Chromera_velia_CCMP2878 / gene_product=hypothetical protein / transcript_product=hypothetical protein / location=Cvel_scaffold3922:7427-12569(-) / protein_length=1254 / sequence_SO=supercontig / SO=protein_coding / is_pseudo=false